jgi:hypothetical protein
MLSAHKRSLKNQCRGLDSDAYSQLQYTGITKSLEYNIVRR